MPKKQIHAPDKFINERTVGQILRKIFLDTSVTQTQDKNYFIKHTYSADDFSSLTDAETFKRIIGFLPNTKYKGRPFILSVAYNRKHDNFEIMVHNPKMKF